MKTAVVEGTRVKETIREDRFERFFEYLKYRDENLLVEVSYKIIPSDKTKKQIRQMQKQIRQLQMIQMQTTRKQMRQQQIRQLKKQIRQLQRQYPKRDVVMELGCESMEDAQKLAKIFDEFV